MKKLQLETITNNIQVVSNLVYSGVSKSYFFSALRSELKLGNKEQCLASNIIYSKDLEPKEMNQECLEKFHEEALNHFNNKQTN